MRHTNERIVRMILLLALVGTAGCDQKPSQISQGPNTTLHGTLKSRPATSSEATNTMPPLLDPCRLILAESGGDTDLDRRIARAQDRVRAAAEAKGPLEELGWLFVSKARNVFDPGFYTLAEQCAACLEKRSGP